MQIASKDEATFPADTAKVVNDRGIIVNGLLFL